MYMGCTRVTAMIGWVEPWIPPKFGVANLAIDADLPSLPSYRLLTWGERDGCPEARTILTNDARPR